jgi:hypothetical protein
LSAELVLLVVLALGVAAALYYHKRELALGLLAGLVAVSLRALLELDRNLSPNAPERNPESPKPEPADTAITRTRDEVEHEIENDTRSPDQLELDLEREFGHRPRDEL